MTPLIDIQNLNKTFKTDSGSFTALNDVSLQINSGEIFGIIGLSGAGKSTLVRCINMLEKPTKGEIFFDGKAMSTLTRAELLATRRQMSMIFQQFNLLMQKTALENICFPLEISGVTKEEARKKARELLKTVDLSEKEKSYPAQLSGGQKQRVAIARALSTNPKVLLCDEATSALDPTTTRSILTLLKDINKKLGITIVIITHEMTVIEEICNRVAIIDASQIAECGLVSDVFIKPKTAAAKRLVIPETKNSENVMGKKCCRIVFDGSSSFEPVVANMVIETKAPVNILYASTKNIDGKAYGQILLQLPENPVLAGRMLAYLDSIKITYSEETYND
ncbi:MAG: ATP-binding cassette domain-containing protein [Clostridia bacterium]